MGNPHRSTPIRIIRIRIIFNICLIHIKLYQVFFLIPDTAFEPFGNLGKPWETGPGPMAAIGKSKQSEAKRSKAKQRRRKAIQRDEPAKSIASNRERKEPGWIMHEKMVNCPTIIGEMNCVWQNQVKSPSWPTNSCVNLHRSSRPGKLQPAALNPENSSTFIQLRTTLIMAARNKRQKRETFFRDYVIILHTLMAFDLVFIRVRIRVRIGGRTPSLGSNPTHPITDASTHPSVELRSPRLAEPSIRNRWPHLFHRCQRLSLSLSLSLSLYGNHL